MEHLYELEFFDNSQEYKEKCRIAKALIKEQGIDVCRDELDMAIISESLRTCSFGFFIVSRRAYPLRNKGRSSTNYILNGYVLAIYNPNVPEQLSIKIICSRKNYRYGDVLMEAVQSYAKNLGVTRLRLFSLPAEKVVRFYTKHGFVKGETIYFNSGDVKVYEMVKTL